MRVACIISLVLAFARLGACQQIPNTLVHSSAIYHESEPSLAVARDTSGKIHLAAAFKYPGGVTIGRAYSSDTGKTWTFDSVVPPFFSAGNDPSIAFGANGVVE